MLEGIHPYCQVKDLGPDGESSRVFLALALGNVPRRNPLGHILVSTHGPSPVAGAERSKWASLRLDQGSSQTPYISFGLASLRQQQNLGEWRRTEADDSPLGANASRVVPQGSPSRQGMSFDQ